MKTFKVPVDAGVVAFDLGTDDKPDVVAVNVYDMKDYIAKHYDAFKLSHPEGEWYGRLIAAFFGRPYSPEQWSEGRASAVWAICFEEIAERKKAVPATVTPS